MCAGTHYIATKGAKRQLRCNKTRWLDVRGVKMRKGNELAVKGYDKVLKGAIEALDGDEKVIKCVVMG